DALAADIAEARRLNTAFGVNLFVLPPWEIDEEAFAAYARELGEDAARHGLTLDPSPRRDDDHYAAKLALLSEEPVPVVSFTFGLPPAVDVAALQAAGSTVLASVTDPQEARAAAGRSVDALVVQGPAAGGHSAVHDPSRTPGMIRTEEIARKVRAAVALPLPQAAGAAAGRCVAALVVQGPAAGRPSAVHDSSRTPGMIRTEALVRQVRAAVDLPLLGAGGVDGPGAVREVLAAGAEGAVTGTMLLRTDEAGTSPTHRDRKSTRLNSSHVSISYA